MMKLLQQGFPKEFVLQKLKCKRKKKNAYTPRLRIIRILNNHHEN